jgi:hypothetical protein
MVALTILLKLNIDGANHMVEFRSSLFISCTQGTFGGVMIDETFQ